MYFNSTPDAQEMAFKATRNMPFSLVLQKLSSFYASSEICAIRGLLHSNYWIRYSVIYEPNEFQIPASACSSILHFPTASKSKRKEQTKIIALFRCCYFESTAC